MLRKTALALVLTASACAANQAPIASDHPTASLSEAKPATPLNKSHFARSPQGTLSEADLQRILESPLELDLPARVGVLPIVEAEDWRGPGPSYDRVSAGLSAYAKQLPADDAFVDVTEMMPIPSGALGMEALREIAARYKLRYLLLYRENVDRERRGNGFAAGYLTLVGALFLPGSTLSIDGYAEATLFDVKTGIMLFTVRRPLHAKKRSNVWHREHKLSSIQRRIATAAAAQLAKDTRTAVARLHDDGPAAGIVTRRVAPDEQPVAHRSGAAEAPSNDPAIF